ncbi:MAG: SPFH/Band 7/PHB domain protein [Deltaproteobacteria bacterium]|nr:SPFH/Band 7/PHB domain protein [Deltaproteobacteria bacterium]
MGFITSMEIFFIGIVLLAVIFIVSGIKSVPQGYEYTVERFGRFTHVLKPGLNLIIPFIDRIGRRVNMMESLLDVPSQEVITRDNATIRVDGVVFFQVLQAERASYEVSALEYAILNLTITNIRTVMGSMDLDELLSKRDDINAKLLAVIDEATHPWGVKLTRVEIKDITPPRDLVDAMARQMKAERDKRAAVLEAEGHKQSAILKAEGLKQAAVLKAEGEKEAAYREAEARERAAAAEAAATTMVSEAIAKGNINALNYFVAQKYVDSLTALAQSGNQKVLMLPMEISSVVGSLAGMAELLTRRHEQAGELKSPVSKAKG